MNKPVPLFFILLIERAGGKRRLLKRCSYKGIFISYLKLLTCAKECGKLHIVSND